MNAKEFVNYLKGGIELGQLTQFDQNTFEKVVEKLKTVKHEVSEEGNFCTWLQGVLDTSDEPEVSAKKLALITDKLNGVKTGSTNNYPPKNNNNSDNKLRC